MNCISSVVMFKNLIAFLAFNVVETWRQYKLMINLGIANFFEKSSSGFLNNREIYRRGANCIHKR